MCGREEEGGGEMEVMGGGEVRRGRREWWVRGVEREVQWEEAERGRSK